MSTNNPRLVLLCEPHLFGEGLVNILASFSGIDFIGAWPIDNRILKRLSQQAPDILLIGGDEKKAEQITLLAAQILDKFPELSIIRVSMQDNTLQVYSLQRMPARTASLLEVIRKLTLQHTAAHQGFSPNDQENFHAQDNQT